MVASPFFSPWAVRAAALLFFFVRGAARYPPFYFFFFFLARGPAEVRGLLLLGRGERKVTSLSFFFFFGFRLGLPFFSPSRPEAGESTRHGFFFSSPQGLLRTCPFFFPEESLFKAPKEYR